ncbi:MAG: hypothetical protein ACXWXN_02965 [Actinomycetota bacterium]
MPPIRRRIVTMTTAAFVLLALYTLPASAGGITDDERADAGAAFVASMQKGNGSIPAFSPIGSTADAVMAFVAAGAEGRASRDALGYLRAQVRRGNVDGIGLVAKVVQAAVAAGRDPRSFGGENLVAWLRSRIRDDGHIGKSAVFDHALAVLALEAAGLRPSKAVTGWLLDAQCPVGGWSYDAPYDAGGDDDNNCFDGTVDDFFTADTNTTAYAVMALEHARRDAYGSRPFPFFASARDATHGGWEYTPGFGTDANSTALVIQAYVSAGRTIPSGGRTALRSLQPDVGCGAWSYNYEGDVPGAADVGATIGAIPAVLRLAFPLFPSGGAASPRAISRGC